MKKMIALLITTIMIVALIPTSSFAAAGDAPSLGDGSSGNPYQIATSLNLVWLMENSAEWDKHYIQTANINMVGQPTNPIGNFTTKFSGSFNGQRFVITELTINHAGQNYAGLFGYCENATISDTILLAVDISGQAVAGGLVGQMDGGSIDNCQVHGTVKVTYEFVGGLIGYNKGGAITNSATNCTVSASNMSMPDDTQKPRIAGGFVGVNAYNGTIEDCSAEGSVTAEGDLSGTAYGDHVGGFCGQNGEYNSNTAPGYITNCTATGNVRAHRHVAGGFVGRTMNGGTINGCSASGNVLAEGDNVGAFAGGFVGLTMVNGSSFTPGLITKCYATGTATTTIGSYAAGFVGRNQDGATITQCYATGNAISGKSAPGGFAGGNTGGGVISDCYSRGNASGVGYGGAFIGYNNGDITDCYASGTVTVTDPTFLGGFCGAFNDDSGSYTITDCFYDSTVSGQTDDYGSGTPKSTSEMQTRTIFSPWDSSIWHVYDGSYPVFSRNHSDTTYPTVDSFSPSNGASAITVDSNLIINFSENVNAESGNIVIYKSNGVVFETIDVTSTKVTGDGSKTITINPDSSLASNTSYYVLIDATAFNDSVDGSYTGITNTTIWTFSTSSSATPTPAPTSKPTSTDKKTYAPSKSTPTPSVTLEPTSDSSSPTTTIDMTPTPAPSDSLESPVPTQTPMPQEITPQKTEKQDDGTTKITIDVSSLPEGTTHITLPNGESVSVEDAENGKLVIVIDDDDLNAYGSVDIVAIGDEDAALGSYRIAIPKNVKEAVKKGFPIWIFAVAGALIVFWVSYIVAKKKRIEANARNARK